MLIVRLLSTSVPLVFLSVQTLLHVSRRATQKIVENLRNLQQGQRAPSSIFTSKIEVNACILQEISSASALTDPFLFNNIRQRFPLYMSPEEYIFQRALSYY